MTDTGVVQRVPVSAPAAPPGAAAGSAVASSTKPGELAVRETARQLAAASISDNTRARLRRGHATVGREPGRSRADRRDARRLPRPPLPARPLAGNRRARWSSRASRSRARRASWRRCFDAGSKPTNRAASASVSRFTNCAAGLSISVPGSRWQEKRRPVLPG